MLPLNPTRCALDYILQYCGWRSLFGFAVRLAKFTNYAAGTVKTVPYIGARVGAVRTLLAGVSSKVRIRPLSLARTSPASSPRGGALGRCVPRNRCATFKGKAGYAGTLEGKKAAERTKILSAAWKLPANQGETFFTAPHTVQVQIS